MELQGRIEELRRQGLAVAAISYDSQEILAAFSKQRGITFPLLSDVGSATIKRYGILNPVPEWATGPNAKDPAVQADAQKYVSVVRPNAFMIGVAFPGTFMVDRQGRVTSRFFEDFYIERNTVSNIIVQLGGGNQSVAGAKASTAHLEMVTYLSDSTVAPGNRISVVLEIKPRSGMHVYAPGATYRVIALRLEPQPFVRFLPMHYPASEIYNFKPLSERVPVYQKPFTLVQELIVEGTPQAQAAFRGKEALVLIGTLEYQACDDSICYTPMSIPLTWTLKFRALITERPTRP